MSDAVLASHTPAAPPRLSALSRWADRHFKWLLVAPAVLLILALSVYPLLFSLVVSFINYDFQIPGHAFVGLKNFERVIGDPVARWSLAVTAILSGASVAIEFVLGLVLALSMVRDFRGRGLIMSILIVPLFISPVIVGQVWSLLLQRPFGPTNYILSQILGTEVTISWLTQTPWNFLALILADVWQWTPFMFVILLAGLTSIPPNLYEAAELDGVGGWQMFWFDHPAAHRPDDAAGADLPPARRDPDVRHHLHHDRRRPGHADLHGVLLPLHRRLHPVPPVAGDRRELALPDHHRARRHPAGAPAPARGAHLMASAVPPARRRRRRAPPIGRILLLGFFVLFVLLPLYWMFNTSIKPSDDYLAIPPVWFPDEPTLVHYTAALFTYRGLEGLINSIIVSTCATVLSALLGTLMAYSLARYNTGGQHLSFWVLSQRFLPPIGIILPVFLIYRNLGIHDTRFGLIIAYTVFTLPVSVWMMFAYFRGMPRSMEEAAQVDGWTRWQAFWRVAVPLAAPGIVAAAVFAFIACWTEFFFALVLTSRDAFTLPTVFRAFIGFQGAQYGEAAALAIVSLGPSILLGVLAQRHLVRGLTLGAVRG